MFNINLSKEALRETIKINLSKAGFDSDNICAKVCFVLDESYSMQGMYKDGSVQKVLDKLLAISFFLDDDGDIDIFAFNTSGRMLPQADQDNHGEYKFKPNYGGTAYADVMEKVEDFYYGGSVKKAGFIGRMFGKKDVVSEAKGRADTDDKHPVYVFFLTDGETGDHSTDIRALSELSAKHSDMFIQYLTIGDSRFGAIEEIVSNNPTNTSIVHVGDLDSGGDALLEKLITEQVRKVIQK